MTASIVLTSIDQRGVATVTLNRPEIHNACDGAMIDALSAAVVALAADRRVRLLVLRASGKHFQAGADLAWLREVAGLALEDNVAFSRRTTLALRALNAFPRPTLALVHGACFGGGVGMVASCDVAIATESASFALTEVRWGVIPAPIIPQLCAAMGVRNLRRYRRHGRALRRPRSQADRPGPRGLSGRCARSDGGADHRRDPERRARCGARFQAPPARAGRARPHRAAVRGALGAGGGEARLGRGGRRARELPRPAGSALVSAGLRSEIAP
jgi:Enoyl-CoA hydratase/isomerase